ncbi:MAG: hypothetical protein P8Z41_11730 [Anaerolineales bacterium]|jgi:hypothetical protein
MGIVPPRIESPKTIIGVGTRELLIMGTGMVISILIVLTKMSLILKVGLAALFLSLAALLALGRSPATGKTFEEYFLDILRYYRRDRFMQRGYGDVQDEPFSQQAASFQVDSIDDVFERESTKGFIQVRPLPLSAGGFMGVISICFLAMLIVWVFFGGLQEFLLRFGIQ